MAEVGDLIVQTYASVSYTGVVYKYSPKRDSVYIAWTVKPDTYIEKYGYARTNIHNLRGEFQVIKVEK
jgi:hypothetical protein